MSVCIFIVLGIGLIALRRSSYGRRLAAMKDSPAAAATLGQNLIKLKLSVFMLSAAIAGLGGILLSAASINVNTNTFIIFVSLLLVMLTVVGGIGSVAGALMGGVLAGVGFEAITTTFQNLAMEHGNGGGFWNVMANLALVAPAVIGVSLGRNPSGAVPQIVASYRPLWQVKPVLVGGLAAEAAVYLLVLTKVMGDWWLALATLIVAVVTPAVGKWVRPEAFATPTTALPSEPTPAPRRAPVSVVSGAAGGDLADAGT
jgi:hypothetical protein